ncbi:hypothetical protein [uncultured Sphingosinicella sp.]|uniref:hypothetical protein n=1 Tax=uncultured Sphingosinicella sp. TaxID=478748 RepID=UPI0030DCD171|tara:strand:- start:16685 stop:17248 length:564 start_codon:yes stop_codon:yes gene_type:complete
MEKKLSSDTVCQPGLLVDLIDRAARRAHDVLRLPSGILIAKRIEDDGLSRIERLELSPLVDDQLLALAFRRAGQLDGASLREDLIQVFEASLSSFAVEAQRRAVMADLPGSGLPVAAAVRTVDALIEAENQSCIRDQSAFFRAYADLYADLWCDPRLGAPVSVRRIMVTMVTRLHELACGRVSLEGR